LPEGFERRNVLPPSEFGPFGRAAAQKVQKNRNGEGKMRNVRYLLSFAFVIVAVTSDQASRATVIEPSESGFEEGLAIKDGSGDIFDGGYQLYVNVDGMGSTAFNASVMGSDPSFSAAGTIDGVAVNRQGVGIGDNGLDVEKSFSVTDYIYVRYLDSFTNTTGVAISVNAQYDNDMGSDDDNMIETDTGGNGVDLVVDDRWFIHGYNDEDPVAGWALHDGSHKPSSAYAEEDDEDIEWDFTLALDPGETKSLLQFFTARNLTDQFTQHTGYFTDARADLTALFGGSLTDPNASIAEEFLLGLSIAQRQGIINFTVEVVPEPATLSLLAVAGALLGFRRRRRR
jgi:hypothetical protein